MKKSDLYREWARVLDMCEGTKVAPKVCWKLCGTQKDYEPEFSSIAENYEFAVAILEDKPVFANDVIYHKFGCIPYKVLYEDRDLNNGAWTWNPPKKTFNLNGVELPCPEKSVDEYTYDLSIFPRSFGFKTPEDRNLVSSAFIQLLSDAKK